MFLNILTLWLNKNMGCPKIIDVPNLYQLCFLLNIPKNYYRFSYKNNQKSIDYESMTILDKYSDIKKEYFSVHYRQRNICKILGGSFDIIEKLWFSDDKDTIRKLRRRFYNTIDKQYFDVRYNSRHLAKNYGSKYDPSRRLWYSNTLPCYLKMKRRFSKMLIY